MKRFQLLIRRPFSVLIIICMMQLVSCQSAVKEFVSPLGTKIESRCGYAQFGANFVTEQVEVTFSCSSERPTYYPENVGIPASRAFLKPLGLNTMVTFPASAIGPATEDNLELLIRVPPTISHDLVGFAEVRVQFDDGTQIFALRQYMPGVTDPEAYVSEVISIKHLDLVNLIETY